MRLFQESEGKVHPVSLKLDLLEDPDQDIVVTSLWCFPTYNPELTQRGVLHPKR